VPAPPASEPLRKNPALAPLVKKSLWFESRLTKVVVATPTA
jgi:hypothetical protein